MISKILLPTDGSETSQKAADYAVDFAQQVGAELLILSVIDSTMFISLSVPAEATPTHLIEPIEDYLRQAMEAHFKEIESRCINKGVQSKAIIRSGYPIEEIIKEAEDSGVDLIVMGSHGKSALKATVLGSVSLGVIHKDTQIPVLLVRR